MITFAYLLNSFNLVSRTLSQLLILCTYGQKLQNLIITFLLQLFIMDTDYPQIVNQLKMFCNLNLSISYNLIPKCCHLKN